MATFAHGGLRLAALTAVAALALAPAPARAAPRKRARPAPAWIRHEPGPCPRPFSPALLCAVGKARMASEAGREAAVTRARTALAAAVRRARGGEPSPATEDAPISETVRGSAILAVYQARDGSWFALAAIDAPARAAPSPR